MTNEGAYRLSLAVLTDGVTKRFVVLDPSDRLHAPGSAWLRFLADTGRSPNTIKAYGARVAAYLSWTAQTADWRSVNLAHLAMWRRTVSSTRIDRGRRGFRSDQTVQLWMAPVRSFYEWADANGMLKTDVASRLTQVKYFPPGSAAGGEYGARRRVLAVELQPTRQPVAPDPAWIDRPDARAALEGLPLRPRDRFIVDLLYYTGLRAGEALSLFTADMHLAGGSPRLRCRLVDPHLHVRLDNPVENGARAKGEARELFVHEALVERYIDYVLERERRFGERDVSPHVLVNLHTDDERHVGKAMTYAGLLKLVRRCGARIGFPIAGPHMLRHTFATRLVRGIDCEPQPLDVVQALLGHRSITSTRIYTHDMEAAKKAALQAIAPRSLDLALER